MAGNVPILFSFAFLSLNSMQQYENGRAADLLIKDQTGKNALHTLCAAPDPFPDINFAYNLVDRLLEVQPNVCGVEMLSVSLILII
jgi:hypothetical protein